MIGTILSHILELNANKLFIGVTLIIMNLGSKYVVGDLNSVHERILSSEIAKKIILFCMFFVGCRDIMVAICLTFAFSIVINGLLNAKSRFNILPSELAKDVGLISEPEYKKAKGVVEKYEAAISGGDGSKTASVGESTPRQVVTDYRDMIANFSKIKHYIY